MYKVYYYMTGGRYVSSRNFETLKDATDFAINQPIESVIEIKHYDIEVSDIQNESDRIMRN
jgi:hypothetical protein